MEKKQAVKHRDELRPEYDLSRLKSAVRGEYHRRAAAEMNPAISGLRSGRNRRSSGST